MYGPFGPHFFAPRESSDRRKTYSRQEMEINHYSSKSKEEFEVKKKKGGGASTSYRHHQWKSYDVNDIKDAYARDKYLGRLEQALR